METSQGLPEADVRAMVGLLADVAVVEGGLAARKHALMRGLRALVDADGWLWSMTRVDMEVGVPICFGLMHEGLSEQQLIGWLEASQTSTPPPEDAPCTDLFKTRRHFTRTRQQIVPDATWYAHPTVEQYRLRLGLDHFVYSVYPLHDDPEVCSAIGLFRRVRREPFSDRDARLAHILLSEVEWLHYAELSGDRGRRVPELSPRQRVVLIMLIEARDKDDIARLLHISPHTVKDHIKAIYEHFDVSSQLELIRRFRFGDEGDRA